MRSSERLSCLKVREPDGVWVILVALVAEKPKLQAANSKENSSFDLQPARHKRTVDWQLNFGAYLEFEFESLEFWLS